MSVPSNLTSLRVTIENAIAEVVLQGPGKGNAMGPDFWREMPVVFEALDRDPSVRAVVVRDRTGNLPPMPGIFPDCPAPIIRLAEGDRELAYARWGMPSRSRTRRPIPSGDTTHG